MIYYNRLVIFWATLLPPLGGNTLCGSGYVLGLTPVRAYAYAARLLPCGQYAALLLISIIPIFSEPMRRLSPCAVQSSRASA